MKKYLLIALVLMLLFFTSCETSKTGEAGFFGRRKAAPRPKYPITNPPNDVITVPIRDKDGTIIGYTTPAGIALGPPPCDPNENINTVGDDAVGDELVCDNPDCPTGEECCGTVYIKVDETTYFQTIGCYDQDPKPYPTPTPVGSILSQAQYDEMIIQELINRGMLSKDQFDELVRSMERTNSGVIGYIVGQKFPPGGGVVPNPSLPVIPGGAAPNPSLPVIPGGAAPKGS